MAAMVINLRYYERENKYARMGECSCVVFFNHSRIRHAYIHPEAHNRRITY